MNTNITNVPIAALFDKILNEAYNKLKDLDLQTNIKINILDCKTKSKLIRNYLEHTK